MNRARILAAANTLLLVLGAIIAWLILMMVFAGVSSIALGKPFGVATLTIGRLGAVVCVLLLLWRLGWLSKSGVAHAGSWRVWLVALAGLAYIAAASLWAFYGAVEFEFHSLIRTSAAQVVFLANVIVGLNEEILFRGLILCLLLRRWGTSRRGLIGSVVATALLFSALHLIQVFAGLSLPAAVSLAFQTCLIAIWWGALVVWGRSIWPAVLLHAVGNAVIAVQGLSVPMVEPEILAYRQILWFSIPLGVLGIWLARRAGRRLAGSSSWLAQAHPA